MKIKELPTPWINLTIHGEHKSDTEENMLFDSVVLLRQLPSSPVPQRISSGDSPVAAVYQLLHPMRNQVSTRRVGELRFIMPAGSVLQLSECSLGFSWGKRADTLQPQSCRSWYTTVTGLLLELICCGAGLLGSCHNIISIGQPVSHNIP